MDALAKLLAEREIERVILDYAAHNDAANWDAVAAMFAENGRVSRPIAPDDFTQGHEAILAAFKARPPRKTRHIVCNIRVDIDGSIATASSQILLFTGQDTAPLVGSYADILTNAGNGWRFVERRGSLDFPKD
jgi:ketosteroid isomerase-like protein